MPFSELIEVTNSPDTVDKKLALQMLTENANRLSSAQHPFIQTDLNILEVNELGDGDCDSHLLIDVTRQIPLVIYEGDEPVVAAASCTFNMFADATHSADNKAFTSVKVDADLLVKSDYLSNQNRQDEVVMIDYRINGVLQEDREVIALMENLLFTFDDRDYIDAMLEQRLVNAQKDLLYFVRAIHKINGLQFEHFYKVSSPYPLESEDFALYKSLAYSGLYGVSQSFSDDFDFTTAQFTKPFSELNLHSACEIDWDDGFSLVRLLVEPFNEDEHGGYPLMQHYLMPSAEIKPLKCSYGHSAA